MRDKKIKLEFYRTFPGKDPTAAALRSEDQLYECNAMFAPDHPEDGKSLLCFCSLISF